MDDLAVAGDESYDISQLAVVYQLVELGIQFCKAIFGETLQ
jgi:hypothetical protein